MLAALVLSSLVGLVVVIATTQLVAENRRSHTRDQTTFDGQSARVIDVAERACRNRRLVEEARERVHRKHAAG